MDKMLEMWTFFPFLLVISSISFVNSHEIDQSIANIIADASSVLFFPVASITALLCAKTENIVNLSNVLSKNGIPINYLETHNFYESLRCFQQHKTIILFDYDCPQSMNILQEANDLMLFSFPLKWLIIQDSRDVRSSTDCIGDCLLLRNLSDFSIYPDSEVTVLHVKSANYAEISSIYRPSPVRNMIIEHRGFWNSKTGINMTDTQVASRRRRNIQGTLLKSTIVVTKPDTLNHLTDYHDRHVDPVTKCNYVWLHHLIDAMNATVTWNVEYTWGYPDENGSWNGLMGHLSRKEIDIGGISMFLVGNRMEFAQYIPLSTPTRGAFIFRQPPLSFVSNLFTLPFQRSVWIAVGILLLIIFALIVLTTQWEWMVREVDCPQPTISDNLLLVVGAIAQQGFSQNPTTVSSRIVILMLLMTVLNLYASYSANIVALLQSTTTSIKTLKDLLDSPIQCGIVDLVYNRHFIKLEKDPIMRAIADEKLEPKNGKWSNWMSAEDGIKKVRKGFFAFYMELGPGYKLIQETFEEDEKCGFREIRYLRKGSPTFAIVKKSPYIEIFRVNSLKVQESGLTSRDLLRIYTKRPPCSGGNKFVSVGLRECYFSFYAMGIGAFIALGIFFAELLWMKSVALQEKNSIKHFDTNHTKITVK